MKTSDNITAKVIKANAKTAWISVNRTDSGCNKCSQNSSCGIGSLANLFTRKSSIIKTPNTLSAKKNDVIILSYQAKNIIKYSFIAYFVPIIALFIFGYFAKILNFWFEIDSESLIIFGALSGLFIAGYGLRFYRPDTVSMSAKFNPNNII